jgi:hypothetical protein
MAKVRAEVISDEEALAKIEELERQFPGLTRPPGPAAPRALKAAAGAPGKAGPKKAPGKAAPGPPPPPAPRGLSQEAMAALLAIEVAMSSQTMARALESGPVAAALPSPEDFCKLYDKIKPYIEIALEALDWVPYGATIAKVVRLLMKLGDQYCSA